jgi:exopolysaccharide biosynthesis polyprenyl glycosylphosphotransferase
MAVPATAQLAGENVATLWQHRRPMFVAPTGWRREVWQLRGHRRPLGRREGWRLAAKRLIDIAGSSLALLLFAPLLIAVAIAIKMTSAGPVLFSQNRYGQRNRRFRIYKFRTMYTRLGDISGVRQTTSGDARITRVGRFLRRTSLDELPQLFNVLKGDMSLVGPRPHVPRMRAGNKLYEDLVPYYFQRHTMRPGITGLAQVSGCRGCTADPEAAISRIDYDLDYIETWSLRLDLKIILRTLVNEFLSGTGV